MTPLVEIQWRCKGSHTGCEAQDWRHYQLIRLDSAKVFMEHNAPRSRHFEYRINRRVKQEAAS